MSTEPVVLTTSLGGGALALAGLAGTLPTAWHTPIPQSADEWKQRIRATADSAPANWHVQLKDALGGAGTATARLSRVAARSGVVVTTGQQPGLFGGPLYTLSKALSALELADALERATGLPAAPVFWAATDDADFVEASFVWLRSNEGAVRVALDRAATDGVPMSLVPLGDLSAMHDLRAACGSALDPAVLATVERCYSPDATVGDAYVALLRSLLEPLGIAVLDASHSDVARAARPTLERALQSGAHVAEALAERDVALRAHGFTPQVALMHDLSLVFSRTADAKARVPLANWEAVLSRGGVLSPNVLLRPVVERALLPTVAYVAGPGELAYFAQVSAVAESLDLAQPLGVPRWSGTVLEPDVARILSRYSVEWSDLADEHAVSRKIAKRAAPDDALTQLVALRTSTHAQGEKVKDTVDGLLDPRVVDGAVRNMTFRVDRLERRLLAAVKKREAQVLRELAVARGALFPEGKRQERAHSFIPLLVRYGPTLVEAMRSEARRHAEALVSGLPTT